MSTKKTEPKLMQTKYLSYTTNTTDLQNNIFEMLSDFNVKVKDPDTFKSRDVILSDVNINTGDVNNLTYYFCNLNYPLDYGSKEVSKQLMYGSDIKGEYEFFNYQYIYARSVCNRKGYVIGEDRKLLFNRKGVISVGDFVDFYLTHLGCSVKYICNVPDGMEVENVRFTFDGNLCMIPERSKSLRKHVEESSEDSLVTSPHLIACKRHPNFDNVARHGDPANELMSLTKCAVTIGSMVHGSTASSNAILDTTRRSA